MIRKRLISVSLLVLLLGVSYGVWYFLTKNHNICHIDSTTGNRTTIGIRWFEKSEHLDHGDRVGGGCEDYTYVPDDDFEQHLIYYGYDDVRDDYVLTSNIETVTVLDLWVGDNGPDGSGGTIRDLTGIEDFVALTTLRMQGGVFTNIDLSNNTNLTHFYFGNDGGAEGPGILSSLNLNGAISLEVIILVSIRNLTRLNVSNNRRLNNLILDRCNDLVSLNVKNGNNRSLSLNLDLNRNLLCIQVDDVGYSTANWSLSTCPLAFFSQDCGPS